MTQTKFIGRQFNVGIAKEATRGTALAAQYWLPYDSLTIDDDVGVVKREGVQGVIEKGAGQEVVFTQAKGNIAGRITSLGFGVFLKSIFGTDTVGAVESGVKDHVFTVLQNAQHPSVTFSVVEPNSNAGAGYGYALSMIDSLEMNFEIDKYATYKATFEGNKGATLANTTAYVAENSFRPQDGTIKIASALSGLSGATAINITKATVMLKQNVEADKAIGSVPAIDRLNKEFVLEGSFEMKYLDRVMIDTYLLGDVNVAFSLVFANTGVTIGSTSNPTLTITIAGSKFESVARKIDPKGIVTQTIKFTGYYSIADTSMVSVTLRNTVTSGY